MSQSKKKAKYTNPVSRALPLSLMPSGISGPGTSLKAKLIYCEKDISISPGLGSGDVKLWSLSSLFDPYVTGVGHQPAGFDQLMAIYEQYLVLAAKVTVKFSNTGASGQASQIVGLSITDDVGSSTDIRRYVENGSSVSRILSARGDGNNIGELSLSVNLPTAHGLTYAQYTGDDVYKGTSALSPNEQVYLQVWAQAIDTSDTADVALFVEIEYTTLFTGSKLNTLS